MKYSVTVLFIDKSEKRNTKFYCFDIDEEQKEEPEKTAKRMALKKARNKTFARLIDVEVKREGLLTGGV